MKRKIIVLLSCLILTGLAMGETVIVDDHFDDGAIGTNTTGIGTGFNSFGASGGSVTEANSKATLIDTGNGAARAVITSKEGAAIGSGITRFEFKGLTFALSVAGTGSGPARTVVGVKNDAVADNPDNNTKPGFYVQFESNSFSNTANDGTWNGTSALIYVAVDNTRTVLATWEFDTLNWNSGTQNFAPVLDVTLDLDADGYSLTIEGDTISNVTGALENSYAAAGITNELTTGYAYGFNQTEFPLINLSIDQIVVTEDVWKKIMPYEPKNNAINVPLDQQLSWVVVDENITLIDLYFGTDPNLLAGDRRLTGASASTTSWDPLSAGGMDYDQIYYWRIDAYEPNTLGGPDIKTVGSVWDFTTKSFDAAPVADAGSSIITTLELCTAPNALALNGSVTDDGTSALTVKWEAYDVAFGGGLTSKVTFADETAPSTTATISESGTYILSLSATDATGTDSDQIQIDVYDSDCDAAKATGTRVANYYDRDDNCVVNLLDFEIFALEWLDSTGLAESYLHSITVVAGTDNALFAEYWTGVNGTDPNNLLESSRYPASPNGAYLVVGQLSGSMTGDNYGQRIRGYIVPQTSGTYTFHIASDDGSRLFLSADTTPVDTNPALGNQIAEVPGWGWTNPNEWTKFPEQASAPVTLTAGQYYYVEVLHKEGTGGDNVSVGWSTDGGTTIEVIPGAVLRYALP